MTAAEKMDALVAQALNKKASKKGSTTRTIVTHDSKSAEVKAGSGK
jgi:hypothetical protein